MIHVEYVSSNGIKLRTLFLDNGNWWKLFLKYRHLIRLSIIINVSKLLVCRTSFLGYHHFVCPTCSKSIKVPHSCKSRFCPSCGKKATDIWIKNSFNTLPKTTWQHITFTMPSELWNLFWLNRYLMNLIPLIAANIIKEWAKRKGFLPGIFLAIHTFGRDLKKNIHIHLSSTVGGLSLTYDSWLRGIYFYHESLKKTWRYHIIALLREEFKKGDLKLPSSLKHITSYNEFYSWTTQFYEKTWVVHLNEQSNNMKANVEYLGKYLKRPPIGANRLRGKLLPLVYKLLDIKTVITTKVYISWRTMIQTAYKYDPLRCPLCKSIMLLKAVVLPSYYSLVSKHEEIAHGYFPLLL